MTELRAIETRYKGYRFRSRLEARWAVFFDAMCWQWEYEVEGYTNGSVSYLPDFVVRIPVKGSGERRQVFVEVKRKNVSEEEMEDAVRGRAVPLAKSTGQAVLIVFGLPGEEFLLVVGADGDFHPFGSLVPRAGQRGGIAGNVNPAIRAALGARFEHGETPQP